MIRPAGKYSRQKGRYMNNMKNTCIKSRCWVATIHIANMKKSGLSENEYMNPETLAKHFINKWETSGEGRTGAIAVCTTTDNCYHAHMACYGNTTTLTQVSKVLFDSHVEPQQGTKKQLTDYFNKSGKYSGQKNEIVLYKTGLDNIQGAQGKRSDLDTIKDLMDQGFTPKQIFEHSINFLRYEKLIVAAFIIKKLKTIPRIKDMRVYWHTGKSGSGKSYCYHTLCDKHGDDNVYMLNDLENGGLDYYIKNGAPPILFIDELKNEIKYKQLLTILENNSHAQTHCRYNNCYNFWNEVHIASIFPPEEIYETLVPENNRKYDSLKQLMRRITEIIYHYVEDGEYKSYSMSSSDYIDYNDLKRRALSDKDGFEPVTDNSKIQF